MGRKTIAVMLASTLILFVSCCLSKQDVAREPSIAVLATPVAAFLTPVPSSTFTSMAAIMAAEWVLGREELRWRECETGRDGWQQAEACLGYPLFAVSGPAAVRIESGDLLLQVGGDVYETRTRGDDLLRRASL